MHVIAILNQKGGVGKTTLATNIATKLHLDNERVVLIDSDPQGSARDWHAAGDSELPVIGLDRPNLDKNIQKVAGQFDWVIVDGAPQLTDMAISSIKCADLIIIPVQPSPYDIWASADLVDIIKQRQSLNEGKPKAYFCISRKIANTNLSTEVIDALVGYGLPAMKASTSQRIIYPKSAAQGKSVFDIPKNLDAIEEITIIVEDIKKIV
ncbi:MAG: ParA family partition ATPase [Vicingaceae bacterium]